MAKISIRNSLSPQRRTPHPIFTAHSRVKSEFRKEVDINEIVGRMKRGIQPPPWMTSRTPRFEDMTSLPASFAEAWQIVADAEAAFESLPVEFRREIDHDPRNLPHAPRGVGAFWSY